jgi:hypothetical protein
VCLHRVRCAGHRALWRGESAWKDGAIPFRKPISCHLYPIRIEKLKFHDGFNYHRWPICKPACECGAKLDVPVFRFLKDSLTRKYGAEWYAELEEIHTGVGGGRAWEVDRRATSIGRSLDHGPCILPVAR